MKKKILLLGDDIRAITGVSHICKQLILSSVDKYDWVQIAAQKRNPNEGNIIDVSQSVDEMLNTENSYVRLYCVSGYGTQTLIRNVITSESPDVILHMTDPRCWDWLYRMEHEIRKHIPLCYYHVWDNYPLPEFNLSAYLSCDWIGCISKVTRDCVTQIVGKNTQHTYVPHGVDLDVFTPLDQETSEICRTNLLEDTCEFMIFSNNVNIRRKQLLTLIEGYDKFCQKLKSSASKSVLLLHTNPTNPTGSNLYDAVDSLYPDRNIIFSNQMVPAETLNQMYNAADVTINVASNEGFGLATIESLATETPIIVNKTGGLAEQIDDDNTWGIGITPSVKNLIGSPAVPYIYDDLCSSDAIADAIFEIYEKGSSQRKDMGKLGRQFLIDSKYTLDDMCKGIFKGLESAMKNHVPRNSFECIKAI